MLVSATILGLLVVDALSALTETIELGGWAPWLSFDDGRLVTALMTALSAGAGVSAIGLGLRSPTGADPLPGRAVWVAFGLGCLILGVIDAVNAGLSARAVDALGLIPLATGSIIAWRLRGRTVAGWLMAAGLLLLVLNPIAGAIEVELFSNPDNYTPGAPGEAYLFAHRAWVRIWWVTRFQELSELAAMGCFLLAMMQTTRPTID